MGYLLGILIFLGLLGVCAMGLQRANSAADEVHRRNRESR